MTVWPRSQKFIGLIFSTFFAINFIAGCAVNTLAKGKFEYEKSNSSNRQALISHQGRLSLRIASDTPQSLYGAFTLSGDAQTGELSLNSPLGNTVVKLTWTPQSALLLSNNTTTNTTTAYASAEALIAAVTGAAIPLPALFDWLAGVSTPVEGWEVDLSNMQNPDNPRLLAKRISPQPAIELRIAIEQP
jgi:outer membrane lipoprotein LolB